MGKINKSYFKKILIAMSALFLTLVGNHCGKFSPTDLRLSADGSRGFVTARFFQDDQIYEKDLAFRNLSGYALFEDDIVLGKVDELNSKPLNFVLPSAKTGVLDFEQFNGVQSFAFAIQGGRLWTKGIVPYVITSAVSGATGSVESAMRAITDNTGIKFVKRTNEADYLEFVKSDQANTCGSYVGRQGGAQPVFVQSGGCSLAADVHELLHALGFWHEQSRTDRDTHVEILYENIVEEYKDQFDILPGVILGAYDFNSIMHYGVKFFSKNGKDTIRSRNGEKIEWIVPMSGLDASGLQELYRSELSSGGSECDPATKGGSCNIANGTGQLEGQTCNTANQQWTGGVCRVKSCNSGFQPDTARAACVTSGSNNEAPRGNVDGFIGDGLLGGWAYDPNDANVSIAIHYYIDGAFAGDNIANKVRTDVNNIVNIPGNHGFEFRIPDSYRNGQAHTIKAFGIDLQGQTNPELGSKTFTLGGQVKPVSASFTTTGGRLKISVLNAGPRGETKVDGSFDWTRFLPEKWSTDGNNYYLDQPLSNYTPGSTFVVRFRNPDATGEASLTIKIPDGEGTVQKNQAPVGVVDGFFGDGILAGWAYDPNDPNVSIAIHYYIDGVIAGDNTADKTRTDVNDAIKIPGKHGFEFRIPDSYRNGQSHTIKAYGIDLQGQNNPELGAKSFTLGAQTLPVSASYSTSGGRLKVTVLNAGPRGETKVDGSFDWTRFLPEKWSTDGNNYSLDQPLSNYTPGSTIVVRFRNPDVAGEASLTIKIPDEEGSAQKNQAPVGNVDGFFGDGIFYGWAYDPNDANVSIAIHYYIDGVLAGDNIANKARADVNDIVKIPGNHGFEFRIPDSYRNGQAHTIKAYGIDLQGRTNPELGAKSFTLGAQVKPISASFTTTGGRLKISVLNAGPRGETKIDGSFDWTRFLPEKWSTDGNNYYLDQPLSNYQSGATYVIRFRNPDVAGEASLTVSIPVQSQPVSASFTTSGGRLKMTVLNAGPRGETKIDGSFDWTRFLPEKWSTDGNNYYLDQPLSNYPSGTTYVVHFRNPDVAGEAVLTVRIP